MQRSRVFRAGLAVACALCLAAAPLRAAESWRPPSAIEWRQDLAQLATTLEKVHPNLFARVSRERFAAAVDALSARIPALSPSEIVTGMMQIVALAGDGHTSLDPTTVPAFRRWIPVRFYRFTDGIFVTAAAEPYRELLGRRVLRIGRLDADSAWQLASSLQGADNAFDALQRTPIYLSNAAALEALGIADAASSVALELAAPGSGEATTVRMEPVEEASFSDEFRFWGEIWGPASSAVEYAAWDGRPAKAFYDEQATDLPLHLRYRSTYWYAYDPKRKLFYTQINSLGDSRRRGQTFAEFSRELWQAADESEIDTFVLDIRYNIGGDGSLVNPFVHEILKRDAIDRQGTLFAVVGRATFSAGVMMAQALEEHTRATFVGEPPGAYWKSYGDGTSFTLPYSGLTAWVSTIYHQLSDYVGDERLQPIALPAQFDSAAYFGGRDPALEEILRTRERPLLANLIRSQGAAAGIAEYEKRRAEYRGVAWWAPFTLRELDRLGNELRDAGRMDDALAVYRLNASRHPDHWRVWDSLGEAYALAGDVPEAIRHYEKALAVDPYNNLAPFQRETLAELRAR